MQDGEAGCAGALPPSQESIYALGPIVTVRSGGRLADETFRKLATCVSTAQQGQFPFVEPLKQALDSTQVMGLQPGEEEVTVCGRWQERAGLLVEEAHQGRRIRRQDHCRRSHDAQNLSAMVQHRRGASGVATSLPILRFQAGPHAGPVTANNTRWTNRIWRAQKEHNHKHMLFPSYDVTTTLRL